MGGKNGMVEREWSESKEREGKRGI